MADKGLIKKLSDRFKETIVLLKGNPIPFLAIAFAYSALEMGIMRHLMPMLATHSMKMELSVSFILFILEITLYEFLRLIFITGFFSMILLLVNSQTVTVSDFRTFITKKKVWRILLVEAIIIPIAIAGSLLLILPGIIWCVLTLFSYFLVLKRDDIGILDAVGRSVKMTAGVRTELFTVCMVYGIFSFIPLLFPFMLALVIDTLFVPVLYILIALMFKEKDSAF